MHCSVHEEQREASIESVPRIVGVSKTAPATDTVPPQSSLLADALQVLQLLWRQVTEMKT